VKKLFASVGTRCEADANKAVANPLKEKREHTLQNLLVTLTRKILCAVLADTMLRGAKGTAGSGKANCFV
jgi:hypothetical protein